MELLNRIKDPIGFVIERFLRFVVSRESVNLFEPYIVSLPCNWKLSDENHLLVQELERNKGAKGKLCAKSL